MEDFNADKKYFFDIRILLFELQCYPYFKEIGENILNTG